MTLFALVETDLVRIHIWPFWKSLPLHGLKFAISEHRRACALHSWIYIPFAKPGKLESSK
jgi:hypothetical protein